MKKYLLFALLVPFFSTELIAQGAGNALDFDGTDDYVQIADNNALDADLGNSFTIEAWIRTREDDYSMIFAKHAGGSSGSYYFATYKGGALQLTVITSNGRKDHSVNFSYNDGKWHHVAGVYNGSDLKIYVDGVQQGGATSHSGNVNNTDYPVRIGFYDGSPDWFYNGLYDEIRLWDNARSQAEIREYMCKKLSGSETNLVAYYRFDESSGTSLPDLSSNGNNGSLQNGPNWVTSSAPIGDAIASDYSSPYSVTLASSYGDNLTATVTSGSASGIQVYRVDESPNVTTPPGGWSVISSSHYFGVFPVGSSVVYTVTYDYSGYPGISNESTLALAKRDDNADGTWADAGATLNVDTNTLTKTGETGTEYILGSTSGDNSLPVSLSSFTGVSRNGKVILEWVTESEVENLGFILERQIKGSNFWQRIASYQTNESLIGQGNTSQRRKYTFIDSNVENGATYRYCLSNVDVHGYVRICGDLEVALASTPLPSETVLFPAFPNPFNSNTKISYTIAEDSKINLLVASVLGQTVKHILKDAYQSSGSYNFYWDGKNDAGEFMPSGVYIIILETRSFLKSQKILLTK
jgi:hypothetical protein